MFYWVTTPWWLRRLYSRQLWQMPAADKAIYLTFDDGPHPAITTYVLDELKKYNAKATFFCIGKNVERYNDIYRRILREGHTVGNHTQDHLNGWNSSTAQYVENVALASKQISSTLFRPPYGRIKKQQRKLLSAAPYHFKIIMWTVLSGDFDTTLSPEACAANVIGNAGPGSVIVFHDSEKAYSRLKYALPEVLKHFSNQKNVFKSITL